jgi:Undecaprenyl-phosphate glucose phosphotransferase
VVKTGKATRNIAGYEVEGARLQVVLLAAALPLFLGVHRAAFRAGLRAVRRRGRNLRHVAVVGVGRLGQIVYRTLGRNSWTGINVAYFISHHPQTNRKMCLDRPVHGGLDDLERILETHRVDAVYLAVPNAQAAAVPQALLTLEKFAVDVRIVPDVHPKFVPQSMVVNELDGMPILSYRECPSSGLGGFTKRTVDVIGASVGLLLFGPLILLIAAIVRLTSPGPVIFKQKRVSLGAKVFKIYKFRTMYHVEDELDAARYAHLRERWTERGDPRITPVGRWLRRTSLDELPQLLNVLKGQMSLVGPRPERPELIARFREDWRGYMLRQHVKAGMTGWAQVNGLRGATSLRKRIQYDLFYVRHWSLWFDLRILWLTVFRGFVHRNAH